MKKFVLLTSILVCSAMLLFQVAGAQSSLQGPDKTESVNPVHRSCGMDAHMEKLLQDPAYRKAHEQKLARMENMPQERSPCATPATLPVAVHYQNISNPNIPCLIQLAKEQVDILNADLTGANGDISNWTNNASPFFPGVANGETCVSFCLSTRNHPAGFGLSDGYPAITINQTTGDFNAAWAGYINIYVRGNGGGLLGYSPLGGNGNGDGVVVFLEGWGTGSGCYPGVPMPEYNLGRTLTHEMGHYLLLDHIFSGGCNNLDAVADTPAEAGPYFGCPVLGVATCGSNDMHMNFMDYTNDACMYMFSAGQSGRMENYLNANLQNVIANAANVCGPVTCPPGYYPITEVIYGETVVVDCQICPPGSYCPNGVDIYPCDPGSYNSTQGAIACTPCPANTYNPTEGQTECLDCPSGTSSNAGSTICTEPSTGDDDCDGVPNEDDICPGGDDSVDHNGDGIPDCSQSLPYAQYHADWKCANNKLIVCHVDEDGNRTNLCINKNAVPAHIGHGDWAGPCIGCAEGRSTSGSAGSVGRAAQKGLEMALYPNPTDGKVMVQLNGLTEGEAQLTVLDPLGRVVMVQKIAEGTELLELDFSGKAFARGEYYVRVVTSSDVLTQKLMIAK